MVKRMEEQGEPDSGRRAGSPANPWCSVLLCALPVVLAALVQCPVLRRSFFVDDYVNLYDVIHNGPLEFILRIHGGHSLVVRNGLFYLFYQLFGLEPFPYMLSALCVHLVNVALLWRILRYLAASPLLAAFGATLWGVSPVAVGVIGWYSASCQAMCATVLLWVLGDIARVYRRETELRHTTVIRWCLLLLAGSSTFGSGIGIAMISPLVVLLLLPPGHARRRATLATGALVIAVPILYLIQQHTMGALTGSSDYVSAVSGFWVLRLRPFKVLGSLVDFVSYGLVSLLLGPWATTDEAGKVVTGPFAGRTTTWVMDIAHILFFVFGVMLAGLVWKGPKELRRPVAVVVLLCLVSYGVIVVGRFFLYPGRPDFAVQPRYQYLGPVLLAILVSLLVGWSVSVARLSSRVRVAGAVAFSLGWAAVSSGSVRDVSTALYSRGADEFAVASFYLRHSIERAPPGSTVFIDNQQPFSHGVFESIWESRSDRFPGLAAVFVILYPDDVVEGRRVYFVEKDPERLATLQRRYDSRIARLVVSPAGARLLR